MENSSYQKILNLASTIKNIALEKLSMHEEKTSSTQQKGHSYAGGTPQPIGQNIQAGTDNGYYARADHVHTVDFANIQNTPNALNVVDDLNTNDGSSPLSAKQGKWLNDNKASYQSLNDKNVTVTKLATATTGYIATYEVKQGETSIGKIDIPKDYLVKSGTVETVTVADDPVNGYEIGDKYIDFVINTKDSSGTDEHIYINVKDLIDTYTAGTGLTLSGNTFSLTDASDYVKKSDTSGYIKNDGTIGTPTNTTYTAGTGLTLSGTSFSLTDASNYVKKSIVTNGTDLNTLRTTGFYYQNDAGQTTNNINMPNNKKDAFTLLVESFGANTFTKQTLTFWDRDFLGTVSSETYIRTSHYNNGNWTKWQMIKNNDNIHFLSHNVGDAGYFKFLSLNTVGTYHDQTISFDITHRGSSKTKVEFNFETYQKSGDTTNYWTRISKFYYDGNPVPVYYVQTKDANKNATFDFYVRRNSWDAMGVSDISTSENNRSGLTVTRYNTFSTSLPSGAVQATLNPYYSPVSHSHSYLPLSGGSLTGAVSSNSDITTSSHLTQSSAYNATSGATGNVPVAGLLSTSEAITTYLPKIKSYVGAINFTASGDTSYTNVISARYRNGSSDGNNYGMYLKSKMQNQNQNLIWNRQYSGTWQGERVILDSSNYSTYAATASHTHTKSQITDFPTIPTGSSTATDIKMNGTQSAGVSSNFAKADHVHPVDTSRATSGHGHGNITNGGAISGAASKNVVTDANGKITTENKPTSLPPTFTPIPASSSSTQDLNTYKTGGFYYIGSDRDQAPYVSNCPLSGSDNKSFFLLVETWGASSTNYVKQTLTYYTTNKTYTRTCGGGTWGAWKEFAAANHTHSYISTAAGSVGTSNLAKNAVTSEKIADSAITNDKILNNTITSAKLANKTITGDKIDGGTIFAYNLADLNVTTDKISDSAVTSAKIKDGTIVNGDISSSAAIAYSKLSGVAPTSHNHSTWTEKKSYSNNNKEIHLYVNEQLRLCDLYWQTVSATTANTNITIANDGWIDATYRPHQVAVGGGSYVGITVVGTGGGIIYRPSTSLNSNTLHGQAMWHY